MAWLDIRKQPVVLHAPAIRNRFWEFELVDPWTNNFYNVTSVRRPLGRGDFGARVVATGLSSVRASGAGSPAASSV